MTGEHTTAFQTDAEETDLTDAVRLIYDKAGQEASFVQVVQGRDEFVTRAHLMEEKSCISV